VMVDDKLGGRTDVPAGQRRLDRVHIVGFLSTTIRYVRTRRVSALRERCEGAKSRKIFGVSFPFAERW